jgi:YidC/Oxa1 family membrane protein insertase
VDSYRLFVGTVFAVSLFLLADAWVRDRGDTARAPASDTPAATSGVTAAPPPVPSTDLGAQPPPPAQAQTQAALASGRSVRVRTNYVAAEIDTQGGDLRRVELLQHRARDDHGNFVLFEQADGRTYVAQSGLIGEGLPNHTATFTSEQSEYVLGPDQKELQVRLRASGGPGVEVTKTYVFREGSYVVDVSFEVVNRSSAPIEPFAYFRLLRDANPPEGDSKLVPTFAGAEIYTEKDKLTKVSFGDVSENKAKFPKNAEEGWIAFVQHYFLAAWLPEPGLKREFFLRSEGNGLVSGGIIVPVGVASPGGSATVASPLYVGPQEQDRLEALAPGLELAVDYGVLRVLAVPLFWILSEIHDLVKNWGVAIIVLTILIKLAFYPLSAASYRSMARMKVLAPKLQRLKERYGDDRQKMHEAMIDLYKTEKINPLGGCLPIVVQIPVFIALYWVLLLSVELRHAPFALGIHDLSRAALHGGSFTLGDIPYFALPILMAATMFIQTWLNPAPPDPMQARLMKIMPIAFSVFFFFFPSGLVLYWLVNNVLSIAQQWQITRSMERSKAAHEGS